ncbi:integral membrane protein GPR180 [Strongylocentrotus purpuratus]|uniref:Intimal thickness related receptor IRP domain-containing protein n=1 Tax=Strongylocentrotus purpuratus TaxID=7668 RepID=A0A7M7GJK7_STRPU|nr:integral membrane protein GPR180 [Strongylocentrotus purpuratus]
MRFTGAPAVVWIFLFVITHRVHCKTTLGVFNSLQAAKAKGLFVTEFCFTDTTGGLNYTLNATTPGGKLYFYSKQSWAEAESNTDCAHKFIKAEYSVNLVQKGGNHTTLQLKHAGRWRVMYGDSYTCSPVLPQENPVYISYDIRLFNLDSFGKPLSHFECQDKGLLTYYELLTFVYFVLGCICSPKVYETLKKGGPMHEVMSMLASVLSFQALGAFSMLLNLYRYSQDGSGSSLMENLAELLDIVAQFMMLYMMVSLSLGWTLTSTKTQLNAHVWKTSLLAKIAAGITALQCFSILLEQFLFTQHSAYHSHQSVLGVVTMLGRVCLALIFAHNLHQVVSKEKSIVRREFYTNFAKMSFIWFFAYPVLVFISLLFSHYIRKRFLIMTITSVQATIVVLLYRLFLSRSLYWEISSLSSSSSLPLRLEKNFSMKNYSS